MVGSVKGAPISAYFAARAPADEIAAATPKGRRVAAPSHSFEETEYRTGDNGQEYPVRVPYMTVNCARCFNSATVHGHEKESYDAACCLLRETCPKGESNFYAEP